MYVSVYFDSVSASYFLRLKSAEASENHINEPEKVLKKAAQWQEWNNNNNEPENGKPRIKSKTLIRSLYLKIFQRPEISS